MQTATSATTAPARARFEPNTSLLLGRPEPNARRPRRRASATRPSRVCRPAMSGRIAAILFDFGDTLADEDSERDDDIGGRISSELLPGASELLHGLAAEGRRLAIVADSVKGTGGDS